MVLPKERRVVPVETRVQMLEEVREIDALKNRHVHQLDKAVSGQAGALEGALNHVSPELVWECTHFGRFSGRSQYERFLHQYLERVSLSFHLLTGSVCSLSTDMQAAEGRWAVWQPFTLDGEAWVLAGEFQDRFTKVGADWRISSSRLDVSVLVPWRSGWGSEAISGNWKWHGLEHQ